MSKVIIILLFVSGIFISLFAQTKDSLLVKDSTSFSDTTSVSDSTKSFSDSLNIKKINKDSTGVNDSLILMQKKFDQFKYSDVISMANRLLLQKYPYTKTELLDIYKMLGIAHYSLSEDDAAKKSFVEMLRVDSSYQFDSTRISPKIISFFSSVKTDYIEQQKEIEARTVVRIDTVYIPRKEIDYENLSTEKGAIARSLIIPGLGQIYKEEYFKGTVLLVLSSVAITSSVYYIINTNEKEKAYLVETNPALIESKYQAYNSSFQKRNISLISYGVIWLYTQIDLLFLSDNETERNNVLKNVSMQFDELIGLSLGFKFTF